MAWLRLNEFEAAGFVSDVDAHLLQPQQISNLENAHCVDGVLERYPGYKEFVLSFPNCPNILNSTNFAIGGCGGASWNGNAIEASGTYIQVVDLISPNWPEAYATLQYTFSFNSVTSSGALYYYGQGNLGGYTRITTITPGQTTYMYTATVTSPNVSNVLGFSFIFDNVNAVTWSINELVACAGMVIPPP